MFNGRGSDDWGLIDIFFSFFLFFYGLVSLLKKLLILIFEIGFPEFFIWLVPKSILPLTLIEVLSKEF